MKKNKKSYFENFKSNKAIYLSDKFAVVNTEYYRGTQTVLAKLDGDSCFTAVLISPLPGDYARDRFSVRYNNWNDELLEKIFEIIEQNYQHKDLVYAWASARDMSKNNKLYLGGYSSYELQKNKNNIPVTLATRTYPWSWDGYYYYDFII